MRVPPPRGPKRLRNTAPAKGYDHVEYCPSKSIYVRGIVSPLRDKGKPFGDPVVAYTCQLALSAPPPQGKGVNYIVPHHELLIFKLL